MADIKIPQLGSSAGVAGTDYFVVDDGASTVKASGTQVKQFALGGNKINNLQNLIDNAIAPTEKTPSEHPYSVGDQLIYNDTLYDVTAAISIGDVLTVGTNITVASNFDDKVKDIVSDAWDPDSFEYSAGDYAIYQDNLYKCKLTHTSSLSIPPTNTTYWDDTTIGAEISACNSKLTNKDFIHLGNATPAYPKVISDDYKEILVIACPNGGAITKTWVSTHILLFPMGTLTDAPIIPTDMIYRQVMSSGGWINIEVVKSNSQYTVSIGTSSTSEQPWCCIFGKK